MCRTVRQWKYHWGEQCRAAARQKVFSSSFDDAAFDMLKSLTADGGRIVSGACALGIRVLDWETYLLWLAVGFAAVLGHMFSLFLKFKGGKGVATFVPRG